jgi:hypothetical protein
MGNKKKNIYSRSGELCDERVQCAMDDSTALRSDSIEKSAVIASMEGPGDQ